MDDYSRKSWSQQLWFVAPLTVMILIIAACSSSDDPVSPASTAPPQAPTTITATTAVPTTSGNAQSLTDDEALAISDAYIEAFNTGDADAVLALFTDDVALSDKYSALSDFGNGDPFEAMDRAFFEQELAWNTAQGTTFVSPECAVTEDGATAAVTVSCEFGWLDAAEKAVDAPPVPTPHDGLHPRWHQRGRIRVSPRVRCRPV